MTASTGCESTGLFLAPADGSARQQWRLTRKGPTPGAPSPPEASPVSPSPSSPEPSPSPSTPAPAPAPSPPEDAPAPSISKVLIIADSAELTLSPPPTGCTPETYEIRYSLVGYQNPVVLTDVTEEGDLTAHLNLWPGESYSVIAVGVCAEGALTAPSSPVVVAIPAAAVKPPRPRTPPPPPLSIGYSQKLQDNDSEYFG